MTNVMCSILRGLFVLGRAMSHRLGLVILPGIVLLAGAWLAGTVLAQGGGSGSGIQEYFIPGSQAQMLEMFNDILGDIDPDFCVANDSGNCITTGMPGWEELVESRVSIVAYADASVVLIDQAANGYVAVGDYDPAHYDTRYDLNKGDVLVLDQVGSDQLIGGDRIVSIGGPIFVVRAGWPRYVGPVPLSNGQVLAGYWELYPTAVWGTEYGSPMGENGGFGHVDDRTTKIVVQAKEDGTDVSRNGGLVTTLNRGQSHVIDGVQIGDQVTGNKPLSVSLVASGLQNVAMRFFNLTPPSVVNHEYVLPLSSMFSNTGTSPRIDLVRLYIYAYDATSYTIYQGGASIASGSLGAGGSAVHNVANTLDYSEGTVLGGGLRVVADDGTRLQVLAAVDSNSPGWDWGFPVVGSQYLLDDYYLVWSPATGPNYPSGSGGSVGYLALGHPVFVSPVENNTTIQVDWDNNGTADETVTLNRDQWIALIDESDRDNTGAHVTGSGPFAIAWGEDLLADVSDGFDLGYSILPQPPEFFEQPLLTLDKEVLPEEVLPGGFFDVTLVLSSGPFDIADAAITDMLPTTDFSYRTDSAIVNFPDGTNLPLEPSIVGLDLVWNLKDPSNSAQEYTLPAGQAVIVTFRIDVTNPYSTAPLPDTQVNNAEGFGRWETFEFRPTDFDFMRVVDLPPGLTVVKEAEPEGSQVFNFASTIPDHTSFSLVDDGNPANNQVTFPGLSPGVYTITETIADLPASWTLLEAKCIIGDSGEDAGFPKIFDDNLKLIGRVVQLELNQSVTCIFTNNQPNAATLDHIEAVAGMEQVEVHWTTLSEANTVGFKVMRSTTSQGSFEAVNDGLILSEGDEFNGAIYSFIDGEVTKGVTYYYYIQELETRGGVIDHNGAPWQVVSATVRDLPIYLPLILK